MKHIDVICKQCGNNKKVLKKEYDRQIRNGRDSNSFFCDNSCAAVYKNHHKSDDVKAKNREHLRNLNKNRIQDPFKVQLSLIKRGLKRRGQETTDITPENLKILWGKQNGCCALSGVRLSLRKWDDKAVPNTASIDRIDSNKPYAIQNIQFVCYSLNLAKNIFTQNEMKSFLLEVSRGLIGFDSTKVEDGGSTPPIST